MKTNLRLSPTITLLVSLAAALILFQNCGSQTKGVQTVASDTANSTGSNGTVIPNAASDPQPAVNATPISNNTPTTSPSASSTPSVAMSGNAPLPTATPNSSPLPQDKKSMLRAYNGYFHWIVSNDIISITPIEWRFESYRNAGSGLHKVVECIINQEIKTTKANDCGNNQVSGDATPYVGYFGDQATSYLTTQYFECRNPNSRDHLVTDNPDECTNNGYVVEESLGYATAKHFN